MANSSVCLVTQTPIDPGMARRVILFGSEGGYSRPVLEHLLSSNVQVVAVVLPVPGCSHTDPRFPVSVETPLQPAGLSGLATAHDIPLFQPQTLDDPRLIQALGSLDPEFGLVACFPGKLPATLRDVPRLACWNLHPSLLPAYRGPAPLYWQLRLQETHTGLTLHEATDRLDAGNIVAQRRLPLPDKHTNAGLDAWVAEFGVELFVRSMDDCLHNRLVSIPQDESRASYYPWPDHTE